MARGQADIRYYGREWRAIERIIRSRGKWIVNNSFIRCPRCSTSDTSSSSVYNLFLLLWRWFIFGKRPSNAMNELLIRTTSAWQLHWSLAWLLRPHTACVTVKELAIEGSRVAELVDFRPICEWHLHYNITFAHLLDPTHLIVRHDNIYIYYFLLRAENV